MFNSSTRQRSPTSTKDSKSDSNSGRIKSGDSQTSKKSASPTPKNDIITEINNAVKLTVLNGRQPVNDINDNEIKETQNKATEKPTGQSVKDETTKKQTDAKSDKVDTSNVENKSDGSKAETGESNSIKQSESKVEHGTDVDKQTADSAKKQTTDTTEKQATVNGEKQATDNAEKQAIGNTAKKTDDKVQPEVNDTKASTPDNNSAKKENSTENSEGAAKKDTESEKSQSTTKSGEEAKPKKEARVVDPMEEKYKRLRNLPDDEALARMKWILDELAKLKQYDTLETKFIMMLVSGIYFDYKHLRVQLADIMVKEGFPGTSLNILKEFNRLGLFKSDLIWFPAYFIFNCWWNYSDCNLKFAEALAECDVVTLLTMNCGHEPYLASYATSKNVFYVIKASISILHNIARVGTMKYYFDENKTSEVLVPFLTAEDEMLKILSNLTIAYIVDEDTNKKQILGPETIECIIQWTDGALKSPRQRYRGFTPFELVDGLNKLAVNDSNKMTIVDKGAIPVATKMLTAEDATGQASACRLLWTLSFDKNVRQKIKEDSELIAILENLKKSPETSVCKNAKGALWVINGGNEITEQTRHQTSPSKQHVMISYCWSDKEMVLKVKDRLQAAGYTVWIDIERMGGSTLEAMAEAIEQAAVVLMCMSEKYKNSPNCRTEAEYTFQLRKSYIPLMLQKKYKPDGWLGIMLGAKLFFDFSGKYPFEKPFAGLLKELQSKDQEAKEISRTPIDEPDGAIVASTVPTSYAQPGKRHSTMTSINSSVLNMGQTEVSKWLQNDVKLSSCLNQFEKFKIDGKLLTQLIVMRSEAPEFFYQCLERRLNMDLTEILQFTGALDELAT